MKSSDAINKLADKIELKLRKYADQPVQISQSGTTELFFDSSAKQQDFSQKVMSTTSPVYKALESYYTKNNGAACSFTLDASAEPNSGAKWILNVTPAALKAPIAAALNSIYQSVAGASMVQKQQKADAAAKQGAGSGTNRVAEIELTA